MSIEVKEKVKPAYIEARYNAYLSWDLESEGINLDDVHYWDISRGQLYVKFKNGEEKYIDSYQDSSVDYKHGLEEALVLDEDWNEIKGRSDV
jgi:hypothetical protein|tara:strand:- start:995 stop:1270 length:276 start_codon:yes stop_codon:yes gene_type:complete